MFDSVVNRYVAVNGAAGMYALRVIFNIESQNREQLQIRLRTDRGSSWIRWRDAPWSIKFHVTLTSVQQCHWPPRSPLVSASGIGIVAVMLLVPHCSRQWIVCPFRQPLPPVCVRMSRSYSTRDQGRRPTWRSASPSRTWS